MLRADSGLVRELFGTAPLSCLAESLPDLLARKGKISESAKYTVHAVGKRRIIFTYIGSFSSALADTVLLGDICMGGKAVARGTGP